METSAGVRTFTAGEDLEAFRRVKLSSGEVVYADAGEAHIGVTLDGVSDGDPVEVKLKNHPGTFQVTVAGAITAGAALYGAADGKVDDAVSGNAVFTALADASGDGSIIEALPLLAEAA